MDAVTLACAIVHRLTAQPTARDMRIIPVEVTFAGSEPASLPLQRK